MWRDRGVNETLEQALRAALSDLAANRSTEADARLLATDYRPRSGRLHRRWPVVGAAATLVSAGAATAALLSSAAPEAFAGWTAMPSAPAPSALRTATTLCNALNPAWRLTGTPVLTEARGKYVAEIFVNRSKGLDEVCVSDGIWGAPGTIVGGGPSALRLQAAPGADQLGMPTGSAGFDDGFPGAAAKYRGQLPLEWSYLTAAQRANSNGSAQEWAGLAGRDVRAVALAFDQGVTVDATVENGWYFAWWPGPALPNSVQVTTSSGTTISSPFPDTGRWNRTCPQKSGNQAQKLSSGSCGVFATGQRPSAIRKEQAWLTAHPRTGAVRGALQH